MTKTLKKMYKNFTKNKNRKYQMKFKILTKLITNSISMLLNNPEGWTHKHTSDCVLTLNGAFEECFAGLAGSHSIVKTRCIVSTHETQAFGARAQPVPALLLRFLQQPAGGAGGPEIRLGCRVWSGRVQTWWVPFSYWTVAAPSVRRRRGTVLGQTVRQGGRARWLGLDVGGTESVDQHHVQKPLEINRIMRDLYNTFDYYYTILIIMLLLQIMLFIILLLSSLKKGNLRENMWTVSKSNKKHFNSNI